MKEIIVLRDLLEVTRKLRQLDDKEYRSLLAHIEAIFVEEHELNTWNELKRFVLEARR